jgi:hypothetical protein
MAKKHAFRSLGLLRWNNVECPSWVVWRPNPFSNKSAAHSGLSKARGAALAVLKLMTSSYLLGACTGGSAGFSPLRIRST